MLSHLRSYAPPANRKTGFTAWLFQVTRNTIIDFYRTKQTLLSLDQSDADERTFDVPDPAKNPAEALQTKQFSAEIHTALTILKPLHREILTLKFLEGFSNAEIAHITQKTEGNIRIIQMRALKELEVEMGEKERRPRK